MSQKEVKIPYRECKIMYDVDLKTVAEMAEHYGIEWTDMKSALRQYGFTIRKNEPKPATPPKNYKVVLVDTDKVVVETETEPSTIVYVAQ